MAEPWLLPVDFPAYLEAKIEVDDQSLNPRLLRRVFERVRGLDSPRLLDIGTGTGAMLRRLLDGPLRGRRPAGRPQLMGLDVERQSLEVAARRIGADLRSAGWSVEVREEPDRLVIRTTQADGGPPGPEVLLLCGGLFDPGLDDRLGGGGFDLLTAHAVLDLMPLEPALGVMRGLLHSGSWLYATINYDGLTVLLPLYDDPGFEQRLLELYELSMEQRRVAGQTTAGRWSGRRLCAGLPECGYSILAVGASDWTVFPGREGHAEARRLFLRTLLTFMAGEALAGAELSRAAVERWYRRRLEELERGTLALMTHQLDVLAETRR